MSDILQFSTREEFRNWLFANCLSENDTSKTGGAMTPPVNRFKLFPYSIVLHPFL
ncbi:MAG: hypothetical protein OSJ69_16980 [Acetatifactor sp.]|nr:hypothetical protein [Acetatifactor sp.]